MTIKVGDTIPACTLKTPGETKPADITTAQLFDGKKVVLFAVPGAYTPGCSNTHLPGFIVHADEIKAKGVDTIACLAVNDAFVLGAWSKTHNAEELLMIADGNGELTRKLGLELDASGFGLGMRSKRFAMIVDNGVVKYLGIDSSEIKDSAAEAVLAHL
ncbi:MAG: peroxiredoxin [Verrucomicrobiaceae bacterium]|nr:peroxiredoxin [Verrucomicrobiaceae bacterium]